MPVGDALALERERLAQGQLQHLLRPRAVNGMWPCARSGPPARRGRRGRTSPRRCSRTASRSMPDGARVPRRRARRRRRSARTAATTARGSARAGRGRRRWGSPAGRAGRAAGARCRCGRSAARRASSCACDDDLPGSSVNRSNIAQSLRRSGPRPLAYFLCTACRVTPEQLGDLLPRPALVAGVVHLERLQPLDERPQRPDRLQPDARVPAAGGGCHLRRVGHGCQPRLLHRRLSTPFDGVGFLRSIRWRDRRT